MIVDINMPKLNGLDLMKKIRQDDHNTKAIMLTAHTDEEFLLEAASLKLVKYLKKPIARKELHETLLLSIKELQQYEVRTIKQIELEKGLIWKYESRKLAYFEDEIALTPKERSFLELLCKNANQTVEYDRISEYVWGYDEVGSVDSIKSLVKKLRRKLPHNFIENVFATGYKIPIKS
jgi:DNA-binding response OmpR family regulator